MEKEREIERKRNTEKDADINNVSGDKVDDGGVESKIQNKFKFQAYQFVV